MKDFYKQNYDKHIAIGQTLGFILSWIGTVHFYMKDLGWLGMGIIVAIFGVGTLAFLRECYYGWKKKAPFSKLDIFWSAFGGLFGSFAYSVSGNSILVLLITVGISIYYWKFKK